jgi:hypothetical protein
MTGSQFWLQSRRKSPMLPHHQGACMGRKEKLLKGLQERPGDPIAKTIRSLSPRLYQIITLHNGIAGSPGLSIEEVATRLNISPEEAAENERKGVRQLRHPATSKVIAEAIQQADVEIWNLLVTQANVVYKASLKEKEGQLPGEFRIGIKCVYGSVLQWLERHASQTRLAWYRTEFSKEDLFRTIRGLKKLPKHTVMPISLNRAARLLDVEMPLFRQALALSVNRFVSTLGYLIPRPIGSRALRAVRLHTLLIENQPSPFMTLDQLYSRYVAEYADDDPSVRDLVNAMFDHQHLVMMLGHMGFYGIMPDMHDLAPEDVKDTLLFDPIYDKEATCFFKKPKDGTSKTEIIKAIVEEKGISNIVEIADEFVRRKGDPDLRNVVPQILSQSGEFIQLSPSVYGLWEARKDLDLFRVSCDVLLTKSDIRWYVMARYAGEPLTTFPLWTPAMEMKWCAWAEKYAVNPGRKRLFQSLLHVVEPRQWPADDSEKAYWLRLKEWMGHYFLARQCKYALWDNETTLMDLAKLVISTCETRSMNWIRANRTIGRYSFEDRSITHLSLLIALGVIIPTDHWQKPHPIGPKAPAMKADILKAIKERDPFRWEDGIGFEFKTRLQHLPDGFNFGWVSPSDFQTLLKKMFEDTPEADAEITLGASTSVDNVPAQLSLF